MSNEENNAHNYFVYGTLMLVAEVPRREEAVRMGSRRPEILK